MNKFIDGDCYCPSPSIRELISGEGTKYFCKNCSGKIDSNKAIELNKKSKPRKNGKNKSNQ